MRHTNDSSRRTTSPTRVECANGSIQAVYLGRGATPESVLEAIETNCELRMSRGEIDGEGMQREIRLWDSFLQRILGHDSREDERLLREMREEVQVNYPYGDGYESEAEYILDYDFGKEKKVEWERAKTTTDPLTSNRAKEDESKSQPRPEAESEYEEDKLARELSELVYIHLQDVDWDGVD